MEKPALSNEQRGFTLIEMIIAIVILGVGLAGVLAAFNSVVKSSADPMIRKQMLALAEVTMEEVLLQPYVAQSGSTGSISGCDRSNADEIADYHGYDQAPCALTGAAITNLSTYKIKISVDKGSTLGGIAGNNAAKITVTVDHGSDSISLTGFRTNYAN